MAAGWNQEETDGNVLSEGGTAQRIVLTLCPNETEIRGPPDNGIYWANHAPPAIADELEDATEVVPLRLLSRLHGG